MTPYSSNDLAAALEVQLKGMDLGLFFVSMDHCPSEQLSGNDQWITTVLVVSPHVQHASLAKAMAVRLRPQQGTLRKFGGSRPRYREGILEAFSAEFAVQSGIQVFAISARESAIRNSTAHCVEQLGLGSIYKPIDNSVGTRRISVGPVVNVKTGETLSFTISENRAEMCVFIGHFVMRMRQAVHKAINSEQPTALNWDFFADKLAGGPDGDMDRFFRIILCSGSYTGRIMWGHFSESDSVETDLLADNLAGALNAIASTPDRLPNLPLCQPGGTIFHWERWQ